jgi:tetrahydromethanopterin S-methyltransferase subunit D
MSQLDFDAELPVRTNEAKPNSFVSISVLVLGAGLMSIAGALVMIALAMSRRDDAPIFVVAAIALFLVAGVFLLIAVLRLLSH